MSAEMEFFVDPHRCIGCHACEHACSECETHKGHSMIHIEYVERELSVQTVPVVCMHCHSPTCADVCPADAIKRSADGRVMTFGDNPGNGTFDTRVSIYSPPYLFKGDRPVIANLTSTAWTYGATPTMTANAPITRAALIRPAAVTHSSDPNQRFVELPMTVSGNQVTLHLTSNPNIAPPGWYMLFALGANGVPSVATWVRVG